MKPSCVSTSPLCSHVCGTKRCTISCLIFFIGASLRRESRKVLKARGQRRIATEVAELKIEFDKALTADVVGARWLFHDCIDHCGCFGRAHAAERVETFLKRALYASRSPPPQIKEWTQVLRSLQFAAKFTLLANVGHAVFDSSCSRSSPSAAGGRVGGIACLARGGGRGRLQPRYRAKYTTRLESR